MAQCKRISFTKLQFTYTWIHVFRPKWIFQTKMTSFKYGVPADHVPTTTEWGRIRGERDLTRVSLRSGFDMWRLAVDLSGLSMASHKEKCKK